MAKSIASSTTLASKRKWCDCIKDAPTPLASKRRCGAWQCIKGAPTRIYGPALVCEDVETFLDPKCHDYRGLLIKRPEIQYNVQRHVDNLAKSYAFGAEQSVQADIQLQNTFNLALEISKKAHTLASFAVQHGLPKDLGFQIQQDFEQIGMVLPSLAPTASKLILKLDIMGEHVCTRWHRDHYIGRAVVSYNSCGTMYICNDHVDMHKLTHGCDNAGIVPDESYAFTAGVGDILFMKGGLFPDTPNGLVHKAPEIRYHADGSIVNRLVLKVDLN